MDDPADVGNGRSGTLTSARSEALVTRNDLPPPADRAADAGHRIPDGTR